MISPAEKSESRIRSTPAKQILTLDLTVVRGHENHRVPVRAAVDHPFRAPKGLDDGTDSAIHRRGLRAGRQRKANRDCNQQYMKAHQILLVLLGLQIAYPPGAVNRRAFCRKQPEPGVLSPACLRRQTRSIT